MRSKQTARTRRERTPASASPRKLCVAVAAAKLDMTTSGRSRPYARRKDVGGAAAKSRPAWEQVVRYGVARPEESGRTQGDEDDEQGIDRKVSIVDRKHRRPARLG